MQAPFPKRLPHTHFAASAPEQARAGRVRAILSGLISGLIGLLLLLALPRTAGAQAREIDILEVRPDTGALDLRDHLLFSVESIPIDVFLTYADPTGFVPLDSLDVAGGEGLIGCFYVNNPSESYLSFVLAFGDPHFQAEVIQFREEATRRIQRSGLFLPYSALDRPWGRQGAVELTFPPGALTPVFFRISQPYPGSWRRLPATLYPVDTWNVAVADRLTLQGLLQGFLATLFFVALYRFAKTRQQPYLYLGAMALLTAAHVLAAEHLLPGRLFPEAPHWRRVLFLGLIPAFGTFGVLLVDRLFDGRRSFFTGYAIMSALVFSLGALLTIISPETIYPLMQWHLAGTAAVLLAAAGWLAYRKRRPGHYFPLAGAAAFAAGLALYYWDAYRHLAVLDGPLLLQIALLAALSGLGLGWRREEKQAAAAPADARLPAQPAPIFKPPEPAASPETARDGLRAQPKLLLLVVAGDEEVRRRVRATLGHDFHGLEAANGDEGLHLAIHQIPDLIIADGSALEMDGYDLYRALRADPRTCHIPVILRGPAEAGAEKLQGIESVALHFIPEAAGAHQLGDAAAQLLRQQEDRQRRLRHGEGTAFTSLDRHFLFDLQELVRGDDHAGAPAPEKLSRALGMSRTQLHRKVKGLTGLSLRHFLEQGRQP